MPCIEPWLAIGPSGTVQTSPLTYPMRSNQTMGTISIDISRLGVSELRFLRVSNSADTDPAYTGGGDLAPDFKVMAVMTNHAQLQAMGIFD